MISRYLAVVVIVLSGSICAQPDFSYNGNFNRIGRNIVVDKINTNFQGHPLKQAGVATFGRAVETSLKTGKGLRESVNKEIPQGTVDYALRKSVQVAESYGYDVKGTVKNTVKKCPEFVQNTLDCIAAEETAYDVASAAVIVAAPYVGGALAFLVVMSLPPRRC